MKGVCWLGKLLGNQKRSFKRVLRGHHAIFTQNKNILKNRTKQTPQIFKEGGFWYELVGINFSAISYKLPTGACGPAWLNPE